jgi:putative PEP-CTERM system histidine kinase
MSFDLGVAGNLLALLFYGAFAGAYGLQLRHLQGEQRRGAWFFWAGLLCSAAWAAVGLMLELQPPPGGGVLLALSPWLDAGRYLAWLGFMRWLLQEGRGTSDTRLFHRSVQWLAVGLLIGKAVLEGPNDWLPPPRSVLNHWAAFDCLALAVVGLMLVEQLHHNVQDSARWNAKPVCIALGVVFAFDLYLYSQMALFREADLDAVSIRAGVHAIAVPLLYVAARRHKDWIAKLHVSRAAVFHSATLILSGLYLLVVSAVGYYLRYTGGAWGRALQIALLVLSSVGLLLLFFSGALRAKLRVYISKNFFSYRYDYREEWLRFTAMLSSQDSPEALGQSLIEGLANLVESPGGSLWLPSPTQGGFVQAVRHNAAHSALTIAEQDDFVQFLASSGWILDLDQLRVGRPEPGKPWIQAPQALLDEPRHWLIVPLLAGPRLIAFVVLEHSRARLDVNWEVRDLLKTASAQAAGFLAQVQAAEALLEARKFDAFHKMSAFVVHDLKNIVTQLSLMMKNAQKHRDNPEFQDDMLATVDNSLEKMRQLLMQLRDGQRPLGAQGGVELPALLRRLQALAAKKGRTLELGELEAIQCRGQEDRVERVLGHAVQNALDATPAEGRVWATLHRNGSNAVVTVSDTGVGMSEEFIRSKLFRPFQTTKETGMGIGAFESFQYVQELGGKIEVDSVVGQGTRLTISLPLLLTQEGQGLGMVDAA